MTGRRLLAAAVLLLTAVVVGVMFSGGPARPVAVSSGHNHAAGPDPVTSAVLAVNVIVLIVLGVLARRRRPGVRDTRRGPAWTYREGSAEPGSVAGIHPDDSRTQPRVPVATKPPADS
jgi:hypothetical protein